MLYFIDGQVFFRIWTFYIVFDDLFWADWVLVYKYMKIKGLDLREISSLPKNENVMNMAHHFNHHQKKLISRLICIQWKFTLPNQFEVLELL